MKLGTETASVINHLLSSCGNEPEEEKGATRLLWGDRKAYEVLLVSPDKKTCHIQRYKMKRTDNNNFSEDQEYEYDELEGPIEVIVKRKDKWCVRTEIIEVTKEYNSLISQASKEIADQLISDIMENNRLIYVKGKTKKRFSYNPISIIFGVKEFYQDFSY